MKGKAMIKLNAYQIENLTRSERVMIAAHVARHHTQCWLYRNAFKPDTARHALRRYRLAYRVAMAVLTPKPLWH
jgi:hypothetical protein